MRRCDTQIVSGPPCDGHLGKFDDCLAEALWEWSLEDADATTGDGDFEGHLALVFVDTATTETIDPDGVAREVAVPAGNYLVWTASSGAVTLTTADDVSGAWDVFNANDARYALWGRGCDPDDPGLHSDCGLADECQVEARAERERAERDAAVRSAADRLMYGENA